MGTGRKRMNLWGNGFFIIFIISPRFSQGKRWISATNKLVGGIFFLTLIRDKIL